MPAENVPILEALEECLNLRDKYTARSGQRLGFDPRDHDGSFTGLDEDIAGVSGVRPDADYSARSPPKSPFQKWRIYPRPPPPHWHWKGRGTVIPSHTGPEVNEDEEFDFSKCEIPGADKMDFAIDEKGVYQVYQSAEGLSHHLGFASSCMAPCSATMKCALVSDRAVVSEAGRLRCSGMAERRCKGIQVDSEELVLTSLQIKGSGQYTMYPVYGNISWTSKRFWLSFAMVPPRVSHSED